MRPHFDLVQILFFAMDKIPQERLSLIIISFKKMSYLTIQKKFAEVNKVCNVSTNFVGIQEVKFKPFCFSCSTSHTFWGPYAASDISVQLKIQLM